MGSCGSGDDDASQPQPFAVLSAFPAELAPHLAHATISSTTVFDGHVFHVGVLDGVPVVLALTGIGLVNAAATTRTLLAHFNVQGVVVSAVAGSSRVPIGSVAVPTAWTGTDGTTYAAHAAWLAVAGEIASAGAASLSRCTPVPSASAASVCLPQDPAIVVGGSGQSSDPFGGKAFPCRPGGGDVYGCDGDAVAAPAAGRMDRTVTGTGAAADAPAVSDMETAAIARETAAHNVPFIAFRAVSDGPGDPLGLATLAEFSAYYPLAAHNAAAVTVAFLQKVTGATP